MKIRNKEFFAGTRAGVARQPQEKQDGVGINNFYATQT
jgi:hypothetical protein